MSEPGGNEGPTRGQRLAAWTWIPTLYFASGLPYVAVTKLAKVMYQNLGLAKVDYIAYTSDLTWPWVVKPLWSPLVDVLGTQRRWIVVVQAAIAATLVGASVSAPQENFLPLTLGCFWLLAIASATHDIAADGFYMASMPQREQAWFVGIRSAFYRASMIFGSGALLAMVGVLDDRLGVAPAWAWVFGGLAVFFFAVSLYHAFVLPRPKKANESGPTTVVDTIAEFGVTFASFFQKPGIGLSLAYLLLYRISEAPLGALKEPFLLDPRSEGGLGLSNEQLGLLDGTIGIALLTAGGILGGMVVARDGLRRWIVPMALAINAPNALYAYLAYAQPESIWLIGAAVGLEQLGYGFGFAAYMLYMLQISRGDHPTAHYALCTGFMALGVLLPSRYSGLMQESLGYPSFYVLVLSLTVVSLIVTVLAPLSDEEENAG